MRVGSAATIAAHDVRAAQLSPADSAGLAVLCTLSFGLRLWAASSRLDGGFNFDERFSLRNVSQILHKGELRPSHTMYLGLSYYPQTAVLAASQGLYRATGWELLQTLTTDGKGFTATAYFLCRLVNVVYGVLSLLVTFLIGARLHSPQLGLLAATLLAAFLRHIRSSAHFKPDILVVLLTAVVLYWTLDAVARPALRRFLKVGLGVGLAVATKYTGLVSALPITAAVILFGRRDRRQWGWLVLTGLTAVGTFVVLNPYLGVVLQFIPKVVNGYAKHAVADNSGHGVVLRRQLEFLTEQPAWWVAPFLFVGVMWLLVRTLRPPDGWAAELRAGWSMVLALLIGHTVVHAAGMTLFRAQNYMPMAPAAALVSAWGMIESWRWLARRVAWLARPAIAGGLWGLIALAFLARQFTQVYDGAVPTTWQAAQQSALGSVPLSANSHLIFEKVLGNFLSFGAPKELLPTRVDRLSRLPAEVLDRADVEAFPSGRLDGADGGFYRERMAQREPAEVMIIRPRLFRSRGDAVVLLWHPWQPLGPELVLAATPAAPGAPAEHGGYRVELPAFAEGATASLTVAAPRAALRRRRWTAKLGSRKPRCGCS